MTEKVFDGRIDDQGIRVFPQGDGTSKIDERDLEQLTKAELNHYYRHLHGHAHTLLIQKNDLSHRLQVTQEALEAAQLRETNAVNRGRQRELELHDAARTVEILYAALATTDPIGYLLGLKAWEMAEATRSLEMEMGMVRYT